MVADQVIQNSNGSETFRRGVGRLEFADLGGPPALALQGLRPLRASPRLRRQADSARQQDRLLHARPALHAGLLRREPARLAVPPGGARPRLRGPLPGQSRGPEHRHHGRAQGALPPGAPRERRLVDVREQPVEQRCRHQAPPVAERIRRRSLLLDARRHRDLPVEEAPAGAEELPARPQGAAHADPGPRRPAASSARAPWWPTCAATSAARIRISGKVGGRGAAADGQDGGRAQARGRSRAPGRALVEDGEAARPDRGRRSPSA